MAGNGPGDRPTAPQRVGGGFRSIARILKLSGPRDPACSLAQKNIPQYGMSGIPGQADESPEVRRSFFLELEDCLGAKDQSAVAAEVIALNMNLVGESLGFNHGKIGFEGVLAPDRHERVLRPPMLKQLVVGPQEQMVGEHLGLDRGHVFDTIGKFRLVVFFARTWQASDESPIGYVGVVIGDQFSDTEAVVLESGDMTAGENPAFKLIFAVFDTISALNIKKLRMEGSSKKHHVVSLKAGDFR